MSRFDYSLFASSLVSGGLRSLSAETIALCTLALGVIHRRYLWTDGGLPISDTDWNQLDYDISGALDEIMSDLVGLIIPSISNSMAANRWLLCDGGVYARSDYPKLYEAIDPQYVVSANAFAVPDLRDRFVVGAGAAYNAGDVGGLDSVALSVSELPPHSHSYGQYTFGIDVESVGVPDPSGVGQPAIPTQTSSTGGGLAHENRPPYYALAYYIVAN